MAVEHRVSSSRSKCILSSLVFIVAIIVGMMQVTQSGLNIALARWTLHPLRSVGLQFFIGALLLAPLFIASVCMHGHRDDYQEEISQSVIHNLRTALQEDPKNYVVFCNTLCAMTWISTAIYVAPQIGFGLYAICIVIGQIASSMLIDHFGLLWSEQKKLSIFNVCGSLLAIIGVIVFQIPQIVQGYDDGSLGFSLFVYVILSIFAGACFTTLSALNRRLKQLLQGMPYQAIFILFSTTAVLTLIINVALYSSRNDWFQVDQQQFVWYMFFGGVIGTIVVTLYIICLSHIGFVATYICSIFGSIFISLVYDIVGAFGVQVDQNAISALKIVGVVLVLFGAIMINLKRSGDTTSDVDAEPS